VEGRVRAEHMRNVGQYIPQQVEQGQGGWHVQRRQVGDTVQCTAEGIVGYSRAGDHLSAVHEPVADRGGR